MRASVIVLGLVLAARPAPATAECIAAQWTSLPDGGTVPTRGVFYVHDGTLAWRTDGEPPVTVAWSGALPGVVRWTRVGAEVYRADYAGPAGSRMTVRDFGWPDPTTVVLARDWRPPPEGPRAIGYWHIAEQWACSWNDTLDVQLDQSVAGIRARWTSDGDTTEVLEAPRHHGLSAVVKLGKLDCDEANLALEPLRRGGELELHAIMFDGTERWIGGLPRDLSLAEIPATQFRHPLFGVDEAHPQYAAIRHADGALGEGPRALGILVVALVTAGVLGIALLLRRRPRW